MAIQDNLPKSRITLTYVTDIQGTPKPVVIPLRILMLGDLSLGFSPDRREDLSERKMYAVNGTNFEEVMDEMKLDITLANVENKIDDDGNLTVALNINSMDSFTPHSIIESVPKIQGLKLVEQLLLGVQAGYNNNKLFRQAVNKIYQNPKLLNNGLAKYKTLFEAEGNNRPALALPWTAVSFAEIPESDQNIEDTLLTLYEENQWPAKLLKIVNESLIPLPQVELNRIKAEDRVLYGVAGLIFNVPPGQRTLFKLKDSQTYQTELDGQDYPELKKVFDKYGFAFSQPKVEKQGEQWLVSGTDELGREYHYTITVEDNVMFVKEQQFDKGMLQMITSSVQRAIQNQVNAILHHKNFKQIESTWRSIYDFAQMVEWNNEDFPVKMDLWDVTKEELGRDLQDNTMAPQFGALYDRIYIREYDQYGGTPFGGMIGLYEFTHSKPDMDWLSRMAKVANAAYAPFITSASPKFFKCDSIQELAAIKNVKNLLDEPEFSFWKKLRNEDSAAFIGLVLPKYMVRLPFDPDNNPDLGFVNYSEDVYTYNAGAKAFSMQEGEIKLGDLPSQGTFNPLNESILKAFEDRHYSLSKITFIEKLDESWLITDYGSYTKYMIKTYQEQAEGEEAKQFFDVHEYGKESAEHFLWGNAATLFARNMVRSFQSYGWCQYIRGVRSGGLIDGLPVFAYSLRKDGGANNLKVQIPIEMIIPDYREWEFSKGGFIPLLYRKGNDGVATFFSCQSIKASKVFIEIDKTQESQLVTNLSYTFSVSRIAHYIRCIMRDNIGTSQDETSIYTTINNWLSNYVTTVVDPNDLTLQRFPFKAIDVKVTPAENIGSFDCEVQIVPHIQFEELRVKLMLKPKLAQ
ncbi:type VI secretion system contractile sheath small subunit [Candidatus Uabimicrobium amorphum]|uniref:Intracellular growth locus iglB n=1 Tax=Uabimicrobium amorphum TaxID=2596890 RepID=A0A5S9IR98_UABAM|nr:type VI secretion system contractile sheath small subunit [Candidatus Uabimicrobium amorphum]BBM86663.1 intracellular growth locus iglB [Candidatus Uabimicrobium amorphum]